VLVIHCLHGGRLSRKQLDQYTMLAERWNGTAWTIQSLPTAEGAKESELWGVSCSSATACAPVGDYNTKTFIELSGARLGRCVVRLQRSAGGALERHRMDDPEHTAAE
jgi:hypothetical protein